jgi:hypothetical protein
MDVETLHDAIVQVCPVVSVSVGNADLRETWDYIPTGNATTTQIAAADNVVATIPIKTKATLTTSDFIGRFTNAEYRAATATTWRQTAGNAKNWDVVLCDAAINLNKKKATTLKTSLVTDGILTQARADEIFA